MAHFEKTLDSTLIFDGRVVRLRRDTVELENGHITDREVIEHPGGAAVAALDADGNLLMVRQFRYPFGKELLELPAGKLDWGEAPADCGRRELREECGCTAGVFEPLGTLYPCCAYDEEINYLFRAENLQLVGQKLDPDEFLTVERIPLQAALQLVMDGDILDAKTQIGILKLCSLKLK